MYGYEFRLPGRIICVDGSASKLGGLMERLGGRRVLFVTDEGVREAGLLDRVAEGMARGDVETAEVFDGVPSDPGEKTVHDCARLAVRTGADCIISVGGGSVMDTAKATVILMCEGGELMEHEWERFSPGIPVPPHIAVPTTAGTGSESTHISMIVDSARKMKVIFQGPDLFPDAAVLDPRMTVTLPPELTASTGADAITHAVESVQSKVHEPVTDSLSLEAIRLMSRYLKRAFDDGGDLPARMNTLIAANMAGIAASNAFCGIVHAMSHSVGGLFRVPHGVATAILLPLGMEFNLRYEEVPSRYRRVAESLGVASDRDDDLSASKKAIERIEGLFEELGLPARLEEVGVEPEALDELAEGAMDDKVILVNPGQPSLEEVRSLFEKALR